MKKSQVIILKDNFKAIRKQITGEGLLKAARAGGRVVQQYAMINAERVFSSKSKQELAGSIKVSDSKKTDTFAEVEVGPTVIYGRIQELGGVVLPVFTKMLSWVDDGKRIFAKRVQIPARPYLRPAMDEHENDIRDAVGFQIKKQIESVA